MSQVFLVPYRVSLPETYLELLQLEKGFWFSKTNEAKKVPELFFNPSNACPVSFVMNYKNIHYDL